MDNRWIKSIRKIVVTSLTVVSLVVLSACGSKQTSDEANTRLEEYMDELVPELISGSDFGTKIFFNDPEAFGIELEPFYYEVSTEEDYDETKQWVDDVHEYLKTIDYNQLSDENKINYTVIYDYVSDYARTLDYYELDQNNLGGMLGMQAQLPFSLAEMSLDTVEEVEYYFNLLKTITNYFDQNVELEHQRQENGTGYSKYTIDAIILQAETYASRDDTYLIEQINNKIDAAEGISTEDKTRLKEENRKLVTGDFKNAYKKLAEDFKKIVPNEEILGLSTKPGGKEYFEQLLIYNTGVDMSVSEIEDYLVKKEEEVMDELTALVMANPGIMDELDSLENIQYSNFTSAEENIDYLYEKMQEDFPKTEPAAYEVKQVPEEMKDYFSPAAYFVSKIDAKDTDLQTIILNGAYDQSLFPTIAHESYPGHMYQDVYSKSIGLHPVRSLISYSGYSEGWGNYVERFSYAYAPEADSALIDFVKLNDKLTSIYYIRMDLGIHYYGWTLEDLSDFIIENFGDLGEDVIKEQYTIFLERPGNYLNYFLNSMLLEDLYNEASEELGSKFESSKYHEVILNLGNCNFQLIDKAVKDYIKENK